MNRKIILLPIEKGEHTSNKNKINEIENDDKTHTTRSTYIEKEKHKRIVTNTKKWNFTEEEYTPENQLTLLKSIQQLKTGGDMTRSPHQTCVLQQLNQKIAGYKNQDIIKNIYDATVFITLDSVIQLLIDSELQCYYCKKDIKVLYEIVREPLQWTLDRIDNDNGHNMDNLFISCLSCNLRRKTIYHERYVFTKKCSNVIKLS